MAIVGSVRSRRPSRSMRPIAEKPMIINAIFFYLFAAVCVASAVMVIASGLADRQITAMAQHLREKLHATGQKRVQIEGLGGSDWVLIDAGDIVVHLFMPEARAMYGLEKMWGEDLDEAVAR